MRLFIARNFNNETLAQLISLRDELRSRSKRGNFTVTENLHLTLAFLGECGAKQTADIKNAMNAISFEPFPISIERIGRFKRDGGDIWWAGAQASKPLIGLQSDLSDRLNNAGFTLDKRKYSPHITLGREVVTETEPWQIAPFGETVKSVDIMKSERINGKLTYTAIYKMGG
jgi:2'-5' RNA ligase